MKTTPLNEFEIELKKTSTICCYSTTEDMTELFYYNIKNNENIEIEDMFESVLSKMKNGYSKEISKNSIRYIGSEIKNGYSYTSIIDVFFNYDESFIKKYEINIDKEIKDIDKENNLMINKKKEDEYSYYGVSRKNFI